MRRASVAQDHPREKQSSLLTPLCVPTQCESSAPLRDHFADILEQLETRVRPTEAWPKEALAVYDCPTPFASRTYKPGMNQFTKISY